MLLSRRKSGTLFTCIILNIFAVSMANAFADEAKDEKSHLMYEVTVTNGSSMPISPPILYAKNGGGSSHNIGSMSSAGLIKLCQMGMTTMRVADLKREPGIGTITEFTAPILPGESRSLIIGHINSKAQSLHIEAMYGMTKDTCATASVNSHSLVALAAKVTSEVFIRDSAIQTGAFMDPSLPKGMSYLDPMVCDGVADAISCLRGLAMPTGGMSKIRYFSGYLPSVVSALEMKYGSEQVQKLIFSTAGAVEVRVRLKD